MEFAEPSVRSSNVSPLMRARNPAWTVDELLLALDLYVNHPRARSVKGDPHLSEVSNLLRSLPIHQVRPDPAHFRNVNAVYLKLQNFKAVDPDFEGVGMRAGAGVREHALFARYADRPRELAHLAAAIKREGPTSDPGDLRVEEDREEEGIGEGRILLAAHRRRERRSSTRKKAAVLAETGRLACEVCGFDFEATYGEVGQGFAECHHLRPLTEGVRTTRLADLAIVCSNCHRMIHRRSPPSTLGELRALLV